MPKIRANITINDTLHRRAVKHATETLFTDFAGYVTQLIVSDLQSVAESEAGAPGASSPLVPIAAARGKALSEKGSHSGVVSRRRANA